MLRVDQMQVRSLIYEGNVPALEAFAPDICRASPVIRSRMVAWAVRHVQRDVLTWFWEHPDRIPSQWKTSDWENPCWWTQTLDPYLIDSEKIHGVPDLVRWLLDKGVPPTGSGLLRLCDWEIHQPVALACVQLFHEYGVSLQEVSPIGKNTPLHKAIRAQHVLLAEWLLQQGLDLDAVNAHGRTCLDLADSLEMQQWGDRWKCVGLK
jgi:hypothetical protein